MNNHSLPVGRLPGVVQDIADVIGRERALYLIGQLPRVVVRDVRYPAAEREQVVLYVPRVLRPDHRLVAILGWDDAERLARVFGGELLKPGNCAQLYRAHRDQAIMRLLAEGVPQPMLCEWFEVSPRHVRYMAANLVNLQRGDAANDDAAAIPQEGKRAA